MSVFEALRNSNWLSCAASMPNMHAGVSASCQRPPRDIHSRCESPTLALALWATRLHAGDDWPRRARQRTCYRRKYIHTLSVAA
mmetsp:Transcript_16222/g.48287  ORF Transcript_16222/g.48287 Transcript_16222/m.48287 type:complete len:84 (+) Transcript_16222:3353-3604(+)